MSALIDHKFIPCTCEYCHGSANAFCAECHAKKSAPIHVSGDDLVERAIAYVARKTQTHGDAVKRFYANRHSEHIFAENKSIGLMVQAVIEQFERIDNLTALLDSKQSALSEAHREIAERQRLLDEAIGQIERLKISNQTLLTALDRTAQALGYAFSKKPLRDMAETLAEARAAIAQATKEA